MNGRKNLVMYLGLGISLFGVVLYDPLGLLFRGTGLIPIKTGSRPFSDQKPSIQFIAPPSVHNKRTMVEKMISK